MSAIYELAAALLACVVTELETTAAGAPKRAYVAPGFDPVDDDCCAGQVAVIVERTFATSTFPIQQVTTTPCDAPQQGVHLLVRVTRCVDSEGHPPPTAALDKAAQTVFDDMAATWRAASCCWADDDFEIILDSQDTFGPQGGCTGHQTRLRVPIDWDCGCG